LEVYYENKLTTLTGIVVIILVFGLIFIGCDDPSGGGEKQVVIKIEAITEQDLQSAMVWVFAEIAQQGQPVNTAVGSGNISNFTLSCVVTVPQNNTQGANNPWRGEGNIILLLLNLTTTN
jgi:hypothetical protein